MNRYINATRCVMRRKTVAHIVAGTFTALGLGACSSSPFGPDEGRASMQVGVSAMTATTLGQSIVIDAAVVTAGGQRIPNAGIHWELSDSGILEATGDGRFRVLHEGSVQVAVVWPKDPSVRALVTVKVDASILASACIVRSDQTVAGASPKCAQRRVVVSTATAASMLARAPSTLRLEIGERP